MSAYDQGGGMAQWVNEELAVIKPLHDKTGMPIIFAEYVDPKNSTAQRWVKTIAGMGYTPYITNDHWNIEGRGLKILPPW